MHVTHLDDQIHGTIQQTPSGTINRNRLLTLVPITHR